MDFKEKLERHVCSNWEHVGTTEVKGQQLPVLQCGLVWSDGIRCETRRVDIGVPVQIENLHVIRREKNEG